MMKRSRQQQEGKNAINLTQILHMELVVSHILDHLNVHDFDAFMHTVGTKPSMQWIYQAPEIWKSLLQLHFKGRRNLKLNIAGEVHIEQESDIEEEEADEELDDEDYNEENNENEDTVEENEMEDGLENEMEVINDINADDTSTNEDGITQPSKLYVTLPVWLPADGFCDEASEFVITMQEWKDFHDRVHIVKGDISTITEIHNRPLDALAFPTTPGMGNPHIGAARLIFARAGRKLDDHVRNLGFYLRTGGAHATPGFDAGVSTLIHCHGPSTYEYQAPALLSETFRSVLQEAVENHVTCLGMTSISTGNLGFPVDPAAEIGLATIQQYLRTHSWKGTIGIVCFEDHVYQAFQRQHERILHIFNDYTVTATTTSISTATAFDGADY